MLLKEIGQQTPRKLKIHAQSRGIGRNRRLLSNNRIALQSYHDVAYMADVLVNGKKFTILIDTGSSDFWISCSFISNSDCSKTCPSKSVMIQYGSGNVCVKPQAADIQLGDLSIKNYAFGVAYGSNVMESSSITSNLLAGGSQGLIGLAYSSIASYQTDAGSLINYLKSFSVYLAAAETTKESSFLLLDGVDEDLISKNKWVAHTIPLEDTTHWTIGMTAFKVGDDNATFPCSTSALAGRTNSCNAIIDTGTSLLYMPSEIFEDFSNRHLETRGCTLARGSTLYVCPISVELPRLIFTFGNASFGLSASEYTLPASPTQVYVELQGTGAPGAPQSVLGSSWIIGATFLKKYYSSYQVNESISFYCEAGHCDSNSTTSGPSFDYPISRDNGLSGLNMRRGTLNNFLYMSAIIFGGLFLVGFIWSCVRRCCCKRRYAGNSTGYPGYQDGTHLTPARVQGV